MHGVAICLHSLRNPLPEEWQAYLAVVADMRVAAGGDLSSFRQIVFADGGGPSVIERRAFSDITAKAKSCGELRVAIVSRSLAVRGIITAFRWLGVPLRSFAPDELEEAFAFL